MYADEYNFYAITHLFNLHFIFSTKIFITMRFHHHHGLLWENGEMPPTHSLKQRGEKKERIEYYGHGNDSYFFRHIYNGVLLQNKDTYYKHLCCGSHRFTITHIWWCFAQETHLHWKFFLMMWHYFITTVKLTTCTQAYTL